MICVKKYRTVSRLFALRVLETNKYLYESRGASCSQKILSDITVGKLGEFAVYEMFRSKGVSRPDLSVYSKDKKSYDADLKMYGSNIHVKSKDLKLALRYGLDWTFQNKDPLFSGVKRNDIIALCVVDIENYKADVKTLLKWSDIESKLKEPKLSRFKNNKKCLYWADIKGETNNGIK